MLSAYLNVRKLLRSRVVLAPPEQQEDGRVLHLFRNRAELKKAFGNAQDEIHRLRDRIKLQEGATARVRELLETLEGRLATPAAGLQALIHYQLRALWGAAQNRISVLVRELSAQREDLERKAFHADLNRRSFEALQNAQRALADAERNCADVRAKLGTLQQGFESNQAWWKYFTRRKLARRRHALQAELILADADLTTARETMAEFERNGTPEFPGLSLEARRAINVAAIAYAALLHSRLSATGLVDRAADAMSRGEPRDIGVTNGAALLSTMGEIAKAMAQVQSSAGAAGELKAISEQLREVARYRNATDTAPVPESLDAVGRLDAGKRSGAIVESGAPVNVLREDFWGVSGLLI